MNNDLIALLEADQKICQRGISGYGKILYEKVNDFCADLYGDLGQAITALREQEGAITDTNVEVNLLSARIDELEWNYEAACSTVETRDKEIEQYEQALETLANGAFSSETCMEHKDFATAELNRIRGNDEI